VASIRKREGRDRPWQVRWRDPDGRTRSKAFRRKAEADRYRAEVEHQLHRGDYRDPDGGKVTFREYAEGWRQAQVHRASSAEKVESLLRLHAYPTLGRLQLRQIRPSTMQAWVKGLTGTLAPSTVAVAHGVVASVMKAAVRDRLIPSSPCEGTRLPEDHRDPVVPLTTDGVVALTEAVPDRWRALVVLGAATGLRISEATGLTVDRSGLRPLSARPMLLVDRQLVTPSGQPVHLGPPKRRASRRDVPLPRVAVEALAAHLAAYPPTGREMVVRDQAGRERTEVVELVFTDGRGEPIRRSALSRVWRPAVEAAGLPAGTSYHDLRHYYASLLIAHGESVKVVQARLGHATAAETLDTYSHLWPDSEDRTRDAVDDVLGQVSGGPSVARSLGRSRVSAGQVGLLGGVGR
jgi:integrase